MKLGKLEQKVMERIWDAYPDQSFTVRNIVDDFHAANIEYAYNTIQTVMTHLHEKGLLSRKKEGKTCTYDVQLTKKAFIAEAAEAFLDRMSQQYGSLAIAHFANVVEGVDKDLLAQARKELEELD